eukprot:5515995-Prymnesium_polylepis.1
MRPPAAACRAARQQLRCSTTPIAPPRPQVRPQVGWRAEVGECTPHRRVSLPARLAAFTRRSHPSREAPRPVAPSARARCSPCPRSTPWEPPPPRPRRRAV